jgi:hypothetical protein
MMAEPALHSAVTLPDLHPEAHPEVHPEVRKVPETPDALAGEPTHRPSSAPTEADTAARHRRRGGLLGGLSRGRPGRRGPRSEGGGGVRRLPYRPVEGADGNDLPNTWKVVAGALLVPLGVVFILMSWYGAAHTPYVQQQIPYLVSGSFAGVGCIVLGGLLYWAHWLYRIYDQADLHHQEQLQVIQQTLRLMAERMGASPDGVGRPVEDASTVDSNGDGRFIATEGGNYYHLPSCPVVAHHAEASRAVAGGVPDGMEPCHICRPETLQGGGPA